MKRNEIKLAIAKSENDIKKFINDYKLTESGAITIDLTDCNIYQPYSNKMLLDSKVFKNIKSIKIDLTFSFISQFIFL